MSPNGTRRAMRWACLAPRLDGRVRHARLTGVSIHHFPVGIDESIDLKWNRLYKQIDWQRPNGIAASGMTAHERGGDHNCAVYERRRCTVLCCVHADGRHKTQRNMIENGYDWMSFIIIMLYLINDLYEWARNAHRIRMEAAYDLSTI